MNNYRKNKPLKRGWYIWRIAHKHLDNVTVVFLAEYRVRYFGDREVLSPEFDYWDGYRLHLPAGKIEWAPYDGEAPKTGSEVISIVGEKLQPCPFCGEIPKWQYSGRFIGSGPLDTEYWYTECCSWAARVRFGNPLELNKRRTELLAKWTQ